MTLTTPICTSRTSQIKLSLSTRPRKRLIPLVRPVQPICSLAAVRAVPVDASDLLTRVGSFGGILVVILSAFAALAVGEWHDRG